MKENKYDDNIFFQKYSQMSRSQQGLAGAGEWETLRKLLPDFKDKRVLDLGCGYGWHCIYAMEHGASSVVGVDISHKMLEVGEGLGGNIFFLLLGRDFNYIGSFGFFLLLGLGNGFYLHAEVLHFRILVQEPCLDDGVAEGLAVALGNQTHFVELAKVRDAGFRSAVAHDVGLHVLIGQTLVGFLVGITLDGATDNSVGGVILANLLEVGVFGGHGILGVAGEGGIHYDFALCVRELQGILHSNHFPFYWLGEGLDTDLDEVSTAFCHLLLEKGLVGGLLLTFLCLHLGGFNQLGTGFVEGSDCGVLVQEPGLDFLIGAGFGTGFFCFIGHGAKVHVFLHGRVLFIIVGEDVVFHVLVGQSLVGGLGSLAGSDYYYLIAGVVATDFL